MSNQIKENIEPLFIKVSEAVKLTGIGRNTMLKLVKMKGFPALKSKGKILIDKTQLANWLLNNYSKYVSKMEQ